MNLGRLSDHPAIFKGAHLTSGFEFTVQSHIALSHDLMLYANLHVLQLQRNTRPWIYKHLNGLYSCQAAGHARARYGLKPGEAMLPNR